MRGFKTKKSAFKQTLLEQNPSQAERTPFRHRLVRASDSPEPEGSENGENPHFCFNFIKHNS